MNIIDAYVSYCDDNGYDEPTYKMQVLLRNKLTVSEVTDSNLAHVHRVRVSIARLHGSEDPMSWGDKFDAFCVEHGRQRPTDVQIQAMNEDPFEGAQLIRSNPNTPLLYNALVTFRAHGGF